MVVYSIGLITFYKANLKPVLSYACPAWYIFLADKDKTELERIQKTATRIIFTDTESYEERLSLLNLSSVNDFLFSTAESSFSRISENILSQTCELLDWDLSNRKEKKELFSIFYETF